jgi:hypothetical protein
VVPAAKRKAQADLGGPSEVPPNVAEARAWIAAWRAQQGKAAAPPAASNGNGAAQPAAVKAKAGGGAKAGAKAADGTLVFTAEQLQAVSYDQLLKKK